jgi:formylglycine-generating enzyme required for sulfatase activity
MTSAAGTVRIIRVFVSSPGDVKAEREVLDEVVASINRTDGQAGGFRLELFKWEENVTPQIGPKPQQVVDDQTPEYHVYVGIMSTRFGSGGTAKEFRDALKRWENAGAPWLIFYFDDAPKLTGDPEQAEEYLKVCRFRKQLDKQGKGLYATYRGVRGEKDSLFEQLTIHLRSIAQRLQQESPKKTPSSQRRSKQPRKAATKRPQKPTIPSDYLHWLQEQCADVDLLGLRVQQGQAVTLKNVYVPLTTEPEHEGHRERGLRESFGAGEEDRPVQTLLNLLETNSLYVPGRPGSGKSTFCRWVAWLACEGSMPTPQILPPEKYQETFPPSFRGRLPLLVRLRDFWDYLPQTPGCREMTRAELEAAIADWVDAKEPGGLAWSVAGPHLEAGSLLLILDGVDEVPLTHGDGKHPCQPRAMLLSGLIGALRHWTDSGNRVLLTSRPYGVRESDTRRLSLRHAPLGDLDRPMRELLVRRWFHCLLDKPDSAERMAEQMLKHVDQREDLQPLTVNPMLLTSMCILYHQGGRLPQHRHDLYDRIVDNVLFNRFPDDREVIDPVRNRLAVVAYGMHTGEGLGEERTTPQAEVTYAEIDRMLQTYQEQTSWSEAGYTGAVEAREQLLSRTGLLLPQGERQAGFYHLTLQDFLAAQRLLDLHEEELFDVFCLRGAVPEWRSALSFVFGSQLAKHSSPQRSITLLGRLVDALAEDRVGLGVVVGQCLQILMKRGLRLKDEFEERFRDYCLAVIEQETPLRDRLELGLALGHLGDPRIVVDLRDPTAYVEIPAGTYRVGDDQLKAKYSWVLAETTHEIESPFLLSKYPVTNAQYALFIKENGYADRQWWSAEGWKWREENDIAEPRFWGDAKWNAPNKPVVGVSYWEAEALAKWAGGRIPSEHEWEVAARGPAGHVYPWGDEWEDGVCNSGEAQLGETSPVGIFPRSRSPFGVDDMAGNVWEWCSDLWAATGRVARGGSWAFVAGYCRSASRGRSEPGLRGGRLGFRVAAVPSGKSSQAQENRQAEPGA